LTDLEELEKRFKSSQGAALTLPTPSSQSAPTTLFSSAAASPAASLNVQKPKMPGLTQEEKDTLNELIVSLEGMLKDLQAIKGELTGCGVKVPAAFLSIQAELAQVGSFHEFIFLSDRFNALCLGKPDGLIQKVESLLKGKDSVNNAKWQKIANFLDQLQQGIRSNRKDIQELSLEGMDAKEQAMVDSIMFDEDSSLQSRAIEKQNKEIEASLLEIKSGIQATLEKYIQALGSAKAEGGKKSQLRASLTAKLNALPQANSPNEVIDLVQSTQQIFTAFVKGVDVSNGESANSAGVKEKIERKFLMGADGTAVKIRNDYMDPEKGAGRFLDKQVKDLSAIKQQKLSISGL
jgi:hypothetical protein